MASNVIVVDQAARRHMIKTTPSTPLSDVLQQACSKIGLDPSQYGLKHGEKAVDLSRNIRMSGLSPGAKLTLVQGSKSPSVVLIALQIPQTSDSSGSLARLTDKFPSNTPLWQVLRRFESGVAGGASTKNASYNFTQRATPLMSGQASSGSGRLCYEMPVLNVMGRELATFTDLQKTLAQIGLNSGNALVRLSYRNTERPLEEAMGEISQYFTDLDQAANSSGTEGNSGAQAGAPTDIQSLPNIQDPPEEVGERRPLSRESGDNLMPDAPTATDNTLPNGSDFIPTSSAVEPTSSTSPHQEGISFFRPPSSSTPAAVKATAKHNENDYIPTIVHAQQHQARLNQESRNKRLKSDKELQEEADSRAAALAEVKNVVVRLRFPDQSQAQQSFGPTATTADLHNMCRDVMDLGGGRGSVRLRGPNTKGAGAAELNDGKERLIADLGWRDRILVTVAWGDDVSADARKRPALKEQYRQQAAELKVEMPADVDEPEPATKAAEGKPGSGKDKKQMSVEDRENRLRKLMGKMGGRK